MFNSEARTRAIKSLERSIHSHDIARESVESSSVELHEQRQGVASVTIGDVEAYVNSMSNTPKDFARTMSEFRLQVGRFQHVVQGLELEAASTTKLGSATAGTGALAGIGLVTAGPSVAMAIATTFGTASTGTAISALSGAAATNAALAWLGGGAVATGGAGMAGGGAFIALASPIGWGIAGVTIIGSGVYRSRKNTAIARRATVKRMQVEAELRNLEVALVDIRKLSAQTGTHAAGCAEDLAWLRQHAPSDYDSFEENHKERLAALINHVRSLGALLHRSAMP